MEKTLEILHCCNFFFTDYEIPGFLPLPWEGTSSSGPISHSTTGAKNEAWLKEELWKEKGKGE